MFNELFSFLNTARIQMQSGFDQRTDFFMNLDQFVRTEYAGFLWLIVAVLFLFFEIGTPGLFFFVAFAFGSCFGALVAFLGYPLFVQCVVALVASLVTFWFIKKWFFVQSKAAEKTNVEALVGSHGIVTVSIEPRKLGRVKIRSEQWPAHVADDTSLKESTHVVVVEVRGNRLIVKAVKK